MFRLQLQVMRPSFVPALLAASALLTACGMQKSNLLSGTTGGWYSVSAGETPFYRYGPQQGNGADQKLPHDALLRVIRPSFGYLKVQLESGDTGYVASEDIRPASAELLAEKFAPPPPTVAEHSAREQQFGLNSSDPRLVAPPEPLPEASPTPNYRY
jgi:hypothetical protein